MVGETSYDVVVIGGGPVGENAADYAIRGSDRTAAIVEHELLGGECSYWACMPSKALLGPGNALGEARSLGGSRERASASNPEPSGVLEWRDTVTGRLDDSSAHRGGATHDDAGQVRWANGAGIEVIRGHGRLVGEKQVRVGDQLLTAREAVVIATGSTASVPPIPGLREALPWTSRDATNILEIPERVVVLGGGVVACEAATWLLDLGVRGLVMAIRGDRLLPRMEPFAGERVADALRARGADLRFGTTIEAVDRPDATGSGYGRLHGGPAVVRLTGDGAGELTVDEILVAAGRSPATTDVGLDALGLTAEGPLGVDDHLTVPGHPWLYSVGDVNGRNALTHMGKYQARVAGDVIAARAEGRELDDIRYVAGSDHAAVPQVVFTRPEISSVGLTREQAADAGIDVRVAEGEISVAGSYLLGPDYSGYASVVVDATRDVLLGATFVGPQTGELVHSATVAIVGEVPLARLWHAVPSYPTVSEVWLRLLDQLR
ncbi:MULTISPECIES: dihydrolipoyl dehydrogenase family protein [Gordonia]|uniref:FAD-dependent pyridine nucleotide-disulfide oxidoreductase n=2 Tax=Gordonia alkanivorans TaxID=84096 RepID=W9DM33_9ACTN|nr:MULTISPECIES: NAD(P)/FAD-dependent oxidoreductase [Gordonia]AZZ80712.1 NAD(P)/FAD-dependent oxidoreductase [Gordonia alkanivorans]ETA08440.1 FAD-dependent pyridine nucleotide-disulfide oxidoreductase [Gordonia alkanivorans CGMCC 6845]MDH3008164.1 NAD(P)/FAD-dependent oxidoreductase [Gordonia alkanivorans]MDH3012166.1 NAD(P)/FAD-dependent oxidoreductase [Gordonia alkanivorans]MDH3017106.1 NAD(P)/FAD-dependent oxidoreductase [Gordonia alkanivorans]